jgi:hypothetical protein
MADQPVDHALFKMKKVDDVQKQGIHGSQLLKQYFRFN